MFDIHVKNIYAPSEGLEGTPITHPAQLNTAIWEISILRERKYEDSNDGKQVDFKHLYISLVFQFQFPICLFACLIIC